MYRPRESNVRPRRNTFAAKRIDENAPAAIDVNYLNDNEKVERYDQPLVYLLTKIFHS